MSDARHTWTEPYTPLHAVEPSETDDTRVWAIEPETPSETLNRWIADTFGPGSLGRRA